MSTEAWKTEMRGEDKSSLLKQALDLPIFRDSLTSTQAECNPRWVQACKAGSDLPSQGSRPKDPVAPMRHGTAGPCSSHRQGWGRATSPFQLGASDSTDLFVRLSSEDLLNGP
jgi:hypothetical protein